ncbi:MAG: low molecular weight phosphotyrosine protein phosphatase [Gammaproteobacteria bacterium]|nr:low molecular weight phosphotyrosine protein phosphatase [Gammaproteobacteria bacterium]
MVKVLFICMGNICRSPTSQGVFEKLVDEASLSDVIYADSAGTHAYHVDEPPDKRAQAAAKNRGYNLSRQRARRASTLDFEEFDYVVAMDYHNLDHLYEVCPPGYERKIKLFMDFASNRGEQEVPDPYYGGRRGFERVLDFVEEAARGLLADIRKNHQL